MEFGTTHSSSQRRFDTIGNTPPPSCQSTLVTPAGSPPPAGVIICAKRMAGRAKAARPPDKPTVSPNTWATLSRTARNTCTLRIGAIPIALYRARLWRPIWFSSVGRRSPPPNVPDRIGGPPSSSQAANRYQQRPPDLLPRRALFFCVATKQCCIATLTFMAERPEFGLNFVKISA